MCAAFIIATLDVGVSLRDVPIAAVATPRRTTAYDRRHQHYDRHSAYAVVTFITNGSPPTRPTTRYPNETGEISAGRVLDRRVLRVTSR